MDKNQSTSMISFQITVVGHRIRWFLSFTALNCSAKIRGLLK